MSSCQREQEAPEQGGRGGGQRRLPTHRPDGGAPAARAGSAGQAPGPVAALPR